LWPARRQLHPWPTQLAVDRRPLRLRPFKIICSLPPSHRGLLLTHAAAAQYALNEKPCFSVAILRSLRAEIEALLGFLQSESKTEDADSDA
jgi:hypothetical protein